MNVLSAPSLRCPPVPALAPRMNSFSSVPRAGAVGCVPSPEPAWSVLQSAPVRRHCHVPQRALHGNVRLLVSWGPGVGKTERLLELAAERSRCSRVTFVYGPDKADWVRSRLPAAADFSPQDHKLQLERVLTIHDLTAPTGVDLNPTAPQEVACL